MAFNRKQLSRREFILRSSMGTMGLIGAVGSLHGCSIVKDYGLAITNTYLGTQDPVPDGVLPVEPVKNDINSTISVIRHAGAVQPTGRINPMIVQTMFDKAILSYTGKKNIEEAWGDIVPDLTANDTFGLKINCINPSMPTSPEVVNAVITHLVKIGVKENNIIVWDRDESRVMGFGSLSKSGYTHNSGDKGVRYVTTSTDNVGYDDNAVVRVPSAGVSFPVSSIVSKECKYLINIPQLRHHGKAGITQCMKNYYGNIPLFDTLTLGNSAKMHKDNCNPAIPELYANALFKEKTVLHVCDALFTVYERGPMGSPQTAPGTLMVGKDPVALDYMGLLMVEEERRKRGLSSLMSRAKYIQTAAEMSLGTNTLQQMDIKQINISV